MNSFTPTSLVVPGSAEVMVIGAHHGLGADPPAGADAVLDDHGLAQLLAHFLPDQAGRDVGIAARRGGNDHRDGAGRKILGLYAGTGQRQRAGQGIA
ncbi:Uncharacterised protein [Bordetella pertussis]|nr:Uncharacterised protein [Bordetella pertussis]